nr:formin-like protein 14 [Lolium perenne]
MAAGGMGWAPVGIAGGSYATPLPPLAREAGRAADCPPPQSGIPGSGRTGDYGRRLRLGLIRKTGESPSRERSSNRASLLIRGELIPQNPSVPRDPQTSTRRLISPSSSSHVSPPDPPPPPLRKALPQIPSSSVASVPPATGARLGASSHSRPPSPATAPHAGTVGRRLLPRPPASVPPATAARLGASSHGRSATPRAAAERRPTATPRATAKRRLPAQPLREELGLTARGKGGLGRLTRLLSQAVA